MYDEILDPSCPVFKLNYILDRAETDPTEKYQMLIKVKKVFILKRFIEDLLYKFFEKQREVLFKLVSIENFEKKSNNFTIYYFKLIIKVLAGIVITIFGRAVFQNIHLVDLICLTKKQVYKSIKFLTNQFQY